MSLSTWLSFCVAGLLISLSPGPGAVFAMSMGMQRGYARSLPGIAGMQLGVALQLLVVALGLGAMLAASAHALTVVKWLGAAYLVWLGLRQWRARPGDAAAAQAGPHSRGILAQGFLVNASNPKATVFLLAVLPQFLDAARPLAPQYGAMLVTLTAIDVGVMSGYVMLSARLLGVLQRPGELRWINRLFGSLFIAAGVTLAAWKRAA